MINLKQEVGNYLANKGFSRKGAVNCYLKADKLILIVGVTSSKWTKGQFCIEYGVYSPGAALWLWGKDTRDVPSCVVSARQMELLKLKGDLVPDRWYNVNDESSQKQILQELSDAMEFFGVVDGQTSDKNLLARCQELLDAKAVITTGPQKVLAAHVGLTIDA